MADENNVDIQLTKQHFSVKIYKSYLQYLKKFHPRVNISEVCKHAGLNSEYLSNSDGWVSIEFNDLFMRSIEKEINDKNFAFNVGKASFSPEIMGPVFYLMKHVLSLEDIFGNIWKFPKFFNKVLTYEGTKITNGHIKIFVRANLDILEKSEIKTLKDSMPHIIANSLGFYSGFSDAKKLRETQVSSSRLSDFEYEIDVKYPIENALYLTKLIPSIAIGLLAFGSSMLVTKDSSLSTVTSLMLTCIYILFTQYKQIKVLSQAANSAEDTLNRLDQQYKSLLDAKLSLQRKLEESLALNRLTNSLLATTSEDEILQSATDSITKTLDFDRSLILLKDEADEFLVARSHSSIESEVSSTLKQFKLSTKIDSNDPKKISNVYQNSNPVLIADVSQHIHSLSPESQQVLTLTKSKSFIAAPIASTNERHGVILVDTFMRERKLTQDDLNIVSLAGRQIAMAIERNSAKAKAVEAYIEIEAQAASYSRFVPFEFLQLLGRTSVTHLDEQTAVELNLAIVFCDIRGFTSMSEIMKPAETMSFLNSYFTHLAPIFQKHGGIIDKFMGDGIMALFTDVTSAFNAAAEFQRSLEDYNLKHRSGGKRDFIRTGMGIHYGKVVLGSVGYKDRLSVSVVSDAVNLTSRLDGLTKRFGVDILCSDSAFQQCNIKDNFRLIASLSVEGRKEKTQIYEYFGHQSEPIKAAKRIYASEIAKYVEGENVQIGPIDTHIPDFDDSVLRYYRSNSNKEAS